MNTENVQRSQNALMRRADVERETGLSKTTIYDRIRQGTFPKPVSIGSAAVRWRLRDIEEWLASPATYHAA